MEWTASQAHAISASAKDILVSAAAGSGKTAVLTERILSRLLDREHPIEITDLLVVTFTKAAAAELKERIAKLLQQAIEAYPEGGKRHLSAESALFCQILTEGILAVQPLSFTSFSFSTRIPEDLPRLQVSNIHAFGEVFSISVENGVWSLDTESGKHLGGACEGRITVEFGR